MRTNTGFIKNLTGIRGFFDTAACGLVRWLGGTTGRISNKGRGNKGIGILIDRHKKTATKQLTNADCILNLNFIALPILSQKYGWTFRQ